MLRIMIKGLNNDLKSFEAVQKEDFIKVTVLQKWNSVNGDTEENLDAEKISNKKAGILEEEK